MVEKKQPKPKLVSIDNFNELQKEVVNNKIEIINLKSELARIYRHLGIKPKSNG